MTTDANFKNQEVFFQLISSISSGSDYTSNSPTIFTTLTQKNKDYTMDFLSSLYEIFTKDEYPPTSKFYALYILLKATEANNEFLMSCLAKQKEILTYLFKKVQIDYKKPIKDRGLTFFSKTPSKETSIIGHNFLVILLEAFQHWYVAYGSTDPNSPLHIYQTMFNSLSKQMGFPESFLYVGKKHQVTDDFHSKPAESLVGLGGNLSFGKNDASIEPNSRRLEEQKSPNKPLTSNFAPASREKSQISESADVRSTGANQYSPEKATSEVTRQLYSCIYSGKDYAKNSKVIFDNVAKDHIDYNQNLLEALAEVLEAEEVPGTPKFYCLLLLVKLSETQNKVFNTQFAKDKRLLVKLVQDAKFDYDKPSKEKGKTLFTQDPTSADAVVGKNYMTLLLEAIEFWNKTYQTAEKGTSFYRFRALYSSLAKLVQYSGSTAFIGKEANTSILENNRSFSKIDHLRQFQESSPRKAVGLAGPHVEACVESGDGYKRGLPVIVRNLNGQSREYINDYLDTLANIMEEKEGPPISKLYSLWLLVKTSERVNPALLEAMSKHERLLNRVFQGGQFDYNKPFEEKGLKMYPGYSMVGNKYVNISLEALKFWAEAYGTEDRTSSLYTFKYMYDSLKAQITFPNEYKYIGIPMETDIMLLETTLQSQREPAPIAKTNQNPAFKEIEAGFEKLKEAKTGLKEVLESNQTEDSDMTEFLEFLYQELNSQLKDGIQQQAEPLIGNNNPQAEKYVEQAFFEGELVDQLNTLYERYRGNRITYKNFREQTLALLEPASKNQNVTGKPTPQPTATTNPANQKPVMPNKGGPMGPKIGGGSDPLGAGSIEEVGIRRVPTGQSPQLPTIQEAKGDMMNSDVSHTIFSTSLVGRPGEEERFGGGGRVGNNNNDMRSSARPLEKVIDKNDRNMRESSPLFQKTTYSEFIQPTNPAQQQEQESAKKKPAIIGAGTRPLAGNTPTKNRDNTQEDLLVKKKLSSTGKDSEQQIWTDVQSVKSKVLEEEAPSPVPIRNPRNSPETKQYIMEQRLKWLSHYKFKAGDLLDDQEDAVVSQPQSQPQSAQIPTFRPEEIIAGTGPKLEQGEDRRNTPLKVMEKKIVSEEPPRRSTQGYQVMRSSMVASIRTTPAKNYDSELAGIERSIKTSRVKAGELSKIENSIRNSFTRSGKTLPDFRNLQDMEEREEKDKEISRLKLENSRLQRENSMLKASAKSDDSEDKIALEKMKKLLTNYENQISSLREDVSLLRSENEKLTEDLSLMTEGQNTKNSTAGLLAENRQLKTQIQSLQQELGTNRKEEYPGRVGFSASKDLSSKVLGLQKPNKQLAKTILAAPAGLKDLDLSPRTGPALYEGNFSSRNVAKPKAVKGMHFMETPEPEIVDKRTVTGGQGNTRSPGRKIFEPVSYEMPNPLLEFEDMSRNTTLRSPNNVIFTQPQTRQSAQEVAKRHGVYNVNGSRNLLSPHGDEIINFKPGVGSEIEFPLDFASQNKSAQEKAADRFAESPYNMSQELEKASVDPYQAWEGEDQGQADSEADLRGMISSRDNKGQKEIRGREVNSDNSVFDRIIENMGMSSSDLLKYKVACLKNKCPLYDNNLVQVGVTSTVVHDNTGKRNLLKLVLYHGNKTDEPIDTFTATVQSAKNVSKLVKPDRLETDIAVGKQVKQQVVLSFKGTPFECLVLDASFYRSQQKIHFSLYLPSVITKFMEFKYISPEEFRERWKMNNTLTVLKTRQIVLDPEIIKSAYDFKKYFAYLVDLKPMDEYDFVQGKKGIKLAGVFELEMANIDYMLKINLLPGHKVVFQVACPENKIETAIFLLQTLSFLFQES